LCLLRRAVQVQQPRIQGLAGTQGAALAGLLRAGAAWAMALASRAQIRPAAVRDFKCCMQCNLIILGD
jgi:hypothetical protein